MDNRKEVLFCDLANQLTPRSAINTDRFTNFQWRAAPFTTPEISGTLVSSTPHCHDVSDLTLTPELTGWYRIFVGQYGNDTEGWNEIHVRLSGDKTYRTICADTSVSPYFMQEGFWKCADMTGQTVTISRANWGDPFTTNCTVAFFRFVPMTEEEVAAYQAEQARTDTKRIYATDDIHNILIRNPRSIHDFLTQVEQYRDSDVKVLSMEYLNYLNACNPEMMDATRQLPSRYMQNCNDTTCWFLSNGIDYFKEMIDYGHEIGLDMYLSMRMGFLSEPFPTEDDFRVSFYDEHPELHLKDRDGLHASRMSFAYPETRAFYLDHLSKMAAYDCDGVDLIFNRGYPFILFEEPFLARVQERYGVDARTLPNNDERLQTVRAEFMTQFLREVRERLTRERAERGQKPVRIAAHVHKNLRGNSFMGLDLKTWIREGLIDDIECYPLEQHDDLPDEAFTDETKTVVDLNTYSYAVDHAPDRCHTVWYDTQDNGEEETRALAELVKGTDVKLYVDIMPRFMSPEEYRRRASILYGYGIEGISLWDTYQRAKNLSQWSMMSRLGHKDELMTLDEGNGTLYRKLRLLWAGQHGAARYTPNWGG